MFSYGLSQVLKSKTTHLGKEDDLQLWILILNDRNNPDNHCNIYDHCNDQLPQEEEERRCPAQ